MKQTQQKPFSIHFVCRGNVHRSRLAEAYMRQMSLDGFEISSSGVEALEYPKKTRSSFTEMVLDHQPQLRPYMAGDRQQTNKELLQKHDVIICLDKSVYDDAVRWFQLDPRKTQVWHVEDINGRAARIGGDIKDKSVVSELEDSIFAFIKTNCDKLTDYLTGTSWVDIVDEHNRATGMRLPMAWATDRGLWHRGIHIVVRTSDGKYVVGKRANKIVFAPGMLEITLGGGIDTGEKPLQAAQRETHEELGLQVSEKHFQPLFKHKLHSYHPHYKKRTKTHLYVYALDLPVHSAHLQPQPSEVEELRLLSPRQVNRILRTHRMRHFGPLKWNYKLQNKAIAYTNQPL
jgi:protein-tyrosine-phosphatase/8-oxo-dGTP pyrophosphatase MutT (NUDIX family)